MSLPRIGLGLLWTASLGVAFQWSRSEAEDAVDPTTGVAATAPAARAGEALEMRAGIPDTTVGLSVDPSIPDFRRLPASVVYGFGPIEFTDAVGEELLFAQQLSAEDPVRAYRMLDELTRSLDADGVRAAIAYLDAHPVEQSEDEQSSALGHLSFRLGYLLGPEILEEREDPLFDWNNALLGWGYNEPAAALDFAFNDDAGVDHWMRRMMVMWAAGNKPQETLAWAMETEPDAAFSTTGYALEEFFEQQGSFRELGPFIDQLSSQTWATGLVTAYFLEAARGEPQAFLAMTGAIADESARERLENAGIQDLMSERPLQAVPMMMNRASSLQEMIQAGSSFSRLPARDQETILTTVPDPKKRAALGLQMVLWRGASDLDPAVASALVPAMEEHLPAEWRTALRAKTLGEQLSSEPDIAIQQLRDDFRDFPSTAAAIHEGAPGWEIRLIFEEEQAEVMRSADEALGFELLVSELVGGGE